MGRNKKPSKVKSKSVNKGKSGGEANDTTIWKKPRNPTSSFSLEDSMSSQGSFTSSGRPSRKRSRVEFDEESTSSSFCHGEYSADDDSVFVCGKCQEREKELTRLLEQLSIQDKMKAELEEMTAKYEEEKRQKDEAIMRLSAMASSKLRDNNPNITDLSDKNRPTKIAEKFSELYDNEWTDAFDALSSTIHEEETIGVLLDILLKAYESCKEIASDNYLEKVQRYIEFPVKGEPVVASQCELPDEMKQQIKEFRKSRAVHVIKDVQTAIQSKLQSKYDDVAEVQKYKSSCVEICWMMLVQTPPLHLSTPFHLSTPTSPKFDTNIYKDYTKRGKFIAYTVWPALFLHENGPLLTKGVAQGSKSSP